MSCVISSTSKYLGSHPSRGAWIEIIGSYDYRETRLSSHPSRGAWIEIQRLDAPAIWCRSHPSRGAWIEMDFEGLPAADVAVAPLAGCVD